MTSMAQELDMESEQWQAKSASEKVDALLANAQAWTSQDRDRKALDCYELALSYLDAQASQESLEKAIRMHMAMAALWQQQGKYPVALQSYLSALEEAKAFHKSPHEHVGLCHYKAAQLFEAVWRISPAIENYRRAVEVLTAVWGPDHAQVSKIQSELDAAIEKQAKTREEKGLAAS